MFSKFGIRGHSHSHTKAKLQLASPTEMRSKLSVANSRNKHCDKDDYSIQPYLASHIPKGVAIESYVLHRSWPTMVNQANEVT